MASAKKPAAVKKPLTKSEILNQIAEGTGLARKEVSAVFDALEDLIGKSLKARGPGVFNLPGLLKLRVVKKPATKERKGVNPFTGAEMTIAAKPARRAVKVTALKRLKDMA
ncbi:MAG: HU family DNA-binding protein [Thiotrichales bacterium]